MAPSRQKVFTGPEFGGRGELNQDDVCDWLVEGMGSEAAKATLDNFNWNGEVVAGITLETSPDNTKVVASKMFVTGDLMKANKEINANRLFIDAPKDLRITYSIEDAGVLTFNNGTLIGDFLEDSSISWGVIKKAGGTSSVIAEAEYEVNKIGHFTLRPFLVILSPTIARIVIHAYPLSLVELQAGHPLCGKASFPGLELARFEVDLAPQTNEETGKAWGCPLTPLIYLGGDPKESPNLPSTAEIKARISSTLRSGIMPVTKRDLRTLATAWAIIKESGPSKLVEKAPDPMWPLWTMETQQQGKGKFTIICLGS